MVSAPMPSDRPHATCGARTRSGTACTQRPMRNGRCRMHGGKALKGTAAPGFRDGRYSKYLPAELQAHATEAMRDPELLNQREAIAVLDARVIELFGTLGSGVDWTAVDAAVTRVITATTTAEAAAALDYLRRVVKEGRAAEQTWAEIRATFEDRRKLIESERKRLVEMQQMMSMEAVLGTLAVLLDSFRRHGTPEAYAAVFADYVELVSRTNPA